MIVTEYASGTLKIKELFIHEGMDVVEDQPLFKAGSRIFYSTARYRIVNIFIEVGDIVEVDNPLYEIEYYYGYLYN